MTNCKFSQVKKISFTWQISVWFMALFKRDQFSMRETERTSALYCCFLPSLADIIIGIFNREDFDTKACKRESEIQGLCFTDELVTHPVWGDRLLGNEVKVIIKSVIEAPSYSSSTAAEPLFWIPQAKNSDSIYCSNAVQWPSVDNRRNLFPRGH